VWVEPNNKSTVKNQEPLLNWNNKLDIFQPLFTNLLLKEKCQAWVFLVPEVVYVQNADVCAAIWHQLVVYEF
jgi:hypothetical protein